jgi:sec-independent protein translocase protein TatA
MFDVGGGELLLILLVVLLLFGPKKLPELARAVGKGMRHVRKAQEDLTQQIRDISADVAEPMKSVSADLKENLTIRIDPDATPRQHKQPDTPPEKKDDVA